ncbi:hypothetical protein PI124_g13704 [Phytophthora idaei]|nr:hypothetical protein PI125_g9038 [Phytophthora idaei]KAG3150064.1 hypothetical protein PI126_g11703 [Phytophthora idaei]KAG3241416.1 hypothetical protein PI124_g13704 [Phytophthora idaei]
MQASDAVERRAFLDAAADGKLDGVNAWISARRDVNATLGEGWTALLYAVAHSRMGIVQRLLEEETIDLNATTITGSSALTFALSRKNNSLVALLLRRGASRATISRRMWQELEAATWIRDEVSHMLSPDWSVVWTPTLHRYFPPAEREKCRLVVYANVLALRLLERQASGGVASSSSLSSAVGWKDEVMQQLWWIAAALTGQLTTDEQPVRWRYLTLPLIYHIIEFAVCIW